MKIFGLIMAGGSGKRLWPLSRKKKPKQFLNLTGNNILLNETINRFDNIVDKSNLYLITNKAYKNNIKKYINPSFEKNNIIFEPIGRNTAACIGYATFQIINQYKDGIIIVVPSDSYIDNKQKYKDSIDKAINIVKKYDKVVCIGIKPSFPSTNYGYIKSNENKVLEFKEKPNASIAKEYFESKEYLWNTGIFIYKASTMINMYKELVPDIYNNLEEIFINKKNINNIYSKIRNISIDYAIIELLTNKDMLRVIEADFIWGDLGSWNNLDVIKNKDENNNVIFGKSLLLKSNNNVIYSQKKLIVSIGVDNLIIVDSADAILICKKEDLDGLENINKKLKENEYDKYI